MFTPHRIVIEGRGEKLPEKQSPDNAARGSFDFTSVTNSGTGRIRLAPRAPMNTPFPDDVPPPEPPPDEMNEADTIAEMEAAHARAAAPAARALAEARPPRSGKRFRRLRSAAVCLVAVFVGTGVSVGLGVGKPEPEQAPPALREPGPWTETDADRIDLMIRAGRVDDALELCRAAPRDAYGKDERPLIYREGLCLEGLGQWKEAHAAYGRAGDAPGDVA
ncbi:MAG: hypothetical protein JWO38_1669, partial [Gemmataceae bacterium]|nr:hypothetical protein [Gemmataceae bacterium]